MKIQDLISNMKIFPVCIWLVTEISPYAAYGDRTNPRLHTEITCHAIRRGGDGDDGGGRESNGGVGGSRGVRYHTLK